MKGVILAGGLGTRLRPMTLVTNKHLLPVYDRPMIYYPIQSLVDAGINEILVVTGGEHANDFLKVLRNGRHLGIQQLEYAYQEGEGGIADALSLAEGFAEGERICVVLGDNIVGSPICNFVQNYRLQPRGARILLKNVVDPQRFGVAHFTETGELAEIMEKPQVPPSSLAVTGIYMYDRQVFDICRTLEPSLRGELEITDVNNAYLRKGELSFSILDGWWTDAGTKESLYRATRLVAESRAANLSGGTIGATPDLSSSAIRSRSAGNTTFVDLPEN